MKDLKYKLFWLFILIAFSLTLPSHVQSETLQKDGKRGEPKPTIIKSNTLEVNDNLKVVTFSGDVNAIKDNFVIDCQKMLVYYEKAPPRKETRKPETSINKIIAMGHVRIVRDEGGIATADKAVYYQSDEKMILTGKPLVKQGNDYVEGDRITLFLNENRSVVESAKDKKVRAVIFSKTEKK